MPFWRVRSDVGNLGYFFVFDLDQVEEWAKACGRPFDRKQADIGLDRPHPRSRKSHKKILREERDVA